MMRQRLQFALLCAACLAAAGCAGKHIVSAAPPASVSAPPPEETAPPAPTPPPPVETTAEPPPETPSVVPPLVPAKRPAPPRPRPAPSETAAEPTPPKPAPPQISPQLSEKDLASAKANTAANITAAEKNLQLANGKQLSAAQKDLTGKISGFLSQAHEAIVADDWVRAQNLADKARVLSVELVKSF